QFDLNASLAFWLERLAQSPHLRNENVAEMEAHVRDSVISLQSQGLSEEESFLIAVRRVGKVARLETEFRKVNPGRWNKIIHVLLLIFVAAGCWFLWGTLKIAVMAGLGHDVPAFTRLAIALRDAFVIPPLIALVYCLVVFLRHENARNSWMGFFAAAAGFLILFALPVAVAVYLPLIDRLNHLVR